MALSAIFSEGLKLVPAIASAVMSNRKSSAERRQQELLDQQLQLQRQAFDPNSEIFKQQLAIEGANSQRNIARMVEEATRVQRRNLMMGRNPLFDQERAGDVMNQFSTSEAARAAEAAPDRARANILAMAQGAGSSASSMGGMADAQRSRMAGRANAVNSVLGEVFNPTTGKSIVDIIRSRFDNNAGIQQAAPAKTDGPANVQMRSEQDRTSGGMNMANDPFMQATKLNVNRFYSGGRS